MGRELKRRENKKNGKKIREAVIVKDENPMAEVYKLLKVLGIVLVILLAVYFLVGIFITKEITFGDKKEVSNVVSMNPDYLLASEVFRQKEEKYYVYFYDFNEANSNIETAISAYVKDNRVYKVDIASEFNTKYISDSSNVKAQKKEELKINGLTLMVIENGGNTKYIEGEENIVKYLSDK